jgi:hypothetical protein
MRYVLTIGGLLLILAAAGCSGGSSPELRTESSNSAIRAAEEVGAGGLPRASLHLQLAQEELARAESLADKGEKEEAASYLLRAEADAELAILLSQQNAEKVEAANALERVRQLQNENR